MMNLRLNTTMRSPLVLAAGLFLATLGVLAASGGLMAQPDFNEEIGNKLTTSIDKHWAIHRYKTREEEATAFLVPLGSMKKVRGVWRLEQFEPVDGHLQRVTWQVQGEPINEIFTQFAEQLTQAAEPQWQCQGRGCGNAAEWASRVYQERLLYGRDEFMNYAVFRTPGGAWLSLFSAARTADRQYLHLDIIVPTAD